LLGNLLEWSRMQRGLISFIPANYLLRNKIDDILEMIFAAAKEKKIAISIDISEDLNVCADGNMLDSIIRNLVSNAVKFTPRGGEITIMAKPLSKNLVQISIRDTGIGMDQTRIDHLFSLDIATNRIGTEGESSTGLGLILCKDIIERHGGKLQIESKEGKGTTFSFTLPVGDK
jgi:signal transduction histidine kinase